LNRFGDAPSHIPNWPGNEAKIPTN